MITPIEGSLIIDVQKMNEFAATTTAQDVVNQIEHQLVDELSKVGILRYVEKVLKKVVPLLCTQKRYAAAYVENESTVNAHELVIKREQAYRHVNKLVWDYKDAMEADSRFREAVLARQECIERQKRYTRDIAAYKEDARKSGLAKPIDPMTGKPTTLDRLKEVTMHDWQCLGNVADIKAKTGQIISDPTATFGNNFNPED